MTVLQEVVEVRADLAGRAPAAQLPQGRDHLVHPCSLEQPPRAVEPAGALRRSARKAEQADIADCLYLYREFRSEAVQMLLPVLDTPGSEKRISSFVAALELGLRLHFSGRIDHLRATTRRSPRPAGAVGNPSHGENVATAAPAAGAAPANGGAAHQYLLLYDTVPSGTGYLKELMTQPEKLLSVFEKARDALRSCVCNQDP